MTQLITRRAGLTLASAAILPALAGCGDVTVSTVGSVTTVTIDTAKVDAQLHIIASAGKTILDLAGSEIGAPVVAAIEGAAAKVLQLADQFKAETNGSATYLLDKSSPSAVVTSLLAAAKQLNDTLLSAFEGTARADVKFWLDTANTAWLVIQGVFSAVV